MSQLKVEFPPEERATTNVNIWGVLIGATVITGILAALIYPLDRFGTFFIREMFIGYHGVNWERALFQYLTFWMFALSIMTIVLKFKKLNKELAVVHGDWVPQDLNMRDIPALIKVHENLMAHPDLSERMSLMRMARVLSMWINTEDLGRTQAYAKQETEMDIYVSDSSYKANRLYIWAMPLLGFVGTVFGVSAGIGGFAEFLKGEVTSDMIKVQVGKITEGLAVAFYCTLLGLVTAGIAAFPSLGAEKKEEELLAGVDEYVEDRLLSRMPSSSDELLPADDITAMRRGIDRMSGEKSMDAVVNAIREIKIDFPMDQLSKAIEDGFKRLPNPERYEEVFTRAIGAAHDLVRVKYEEFAKSYEHRVSQLGGDLATKLEGVAERFAVGSEKVSDHLNGQAREIGAAHQGYISALQTAGTTEAQKWQSMAEEFRTLSGQLSQQFQQAVGQMNQASAQYGARVEESSRALAEQMARVVEVGARIDTLLNASRAMETAFVNLGAGREFGETLTTLRTHLTTSDETLKQLAKPRTIVLREETAG